MAKKSATKVEVAPVVDKSGKKGKRESEVALEKKSGAKKPKNDVAVQQAIEKKKADLKTQKKKVESSSSSEESDSDSDDEPMVPVAAPAKKAPAAAVKNGSVPAKEAKDDSSSDSESSDSDSEEEPVAAPAKKVPAAAVKNGSVPAKDDSSSDSESSDSDSEEEPVAAPAKKVSAAAVKNGSAPAKKVKDDSNSDSSDSDSEEEEKTKVTTPAANNESAVAKKADSEESSSEDESDDSSSEEDEAPKKTTAQKTAVAKTPESDDSSSDDESDEEESEDEPAKTPKKAGTDVEMVDAVSEKKAPKTPSTPQATGSKTLFAGNLSFQIEEANLRDFFQSAGEIVSVRFASDQDGRFRGFGHVEFATEAAAQKALQLNQKDLLGRPIKLDLAAERGERGAYTPSSGKDGSSQKVPTVFVKGLDTSLGEEELRGVLEEHFGKCGEITRMSIPKDFNSGGPKGFAYIDFKEDGAFQKALELNQSEVGGFCLTVDEATPRADGGRGGRRGGGRGGRDDGGRSGGRGGRGRGGFNKPNFSGKKTKFDD